MFYSALISYSSKDRIFAQRLAWDLKDNQTPVCFEETGLEPTDSIIEKIRTRNETIDYLIVLLTPAAVSSRWMREEVRVAIKNGIAGKPVTVIPVCITDCKIPSFLRKINYVDMRSKANYQTGLQVIIKTLGKYQQEKPKTSKWQFNIFTKRIGKKSVPTDTDHVRDELYLKKIKLKFEEKRSQLKVKREHIQAERIRRVEEVKRLERERIKADQLRCREEVERLEADRIRRVEEVERLERERIPATERRISVWIKEQSLKSSKQLWLNETYILNFKVGQAVRNSLIDGPETLVSPSDIPEAGLPTQWIVTSSTVELAAITSDTNISVETINNQNIWSAIFPLHIPKEGESAVIELNITPRIAIDAHLQILIYVGKEVYRQLKVELDVVDKQTSKEVLSNPAKIRHDLLHTPAGQTNLKAAHEWTTPPGRTSIYVSIGQIAIITGSEGSRIIGPMNLQWPGVQAQVAGPIKNVRDTAETFRSRWEIYLDDIEPVYLAQRIVNWEPEYDWNALRDLSDGPHQDAWDQVKVSSELRDLAYDGHELYNSFFPASSPMRTWIDSLTPGHRLDISWMPTSGPGWIPHIPWGLMYLFDVPAPGDPVDPMGFMALRFRLSYTAHEVQAGSKALGRLDNTYVGHFLYWGDQPQDVTGVEAKWQRQQWATLQNQVFIPSSPAGSNCKMELLTCLDCPTPIPMTMLYLFCQFAVGAGNDPVLRFGSTSQASELVRRADLGTRQFADQPLVFANACTTSTSDPYIANELEKGFFNRGSRAYLGTESKVPIKFASRFAHVFFHFFWRKMGYFTSEVLPKPMAAGEAVSQTRLFLWTQYRNIGGLFYTYVNQYELFMASDSDLDALRN